MSSFRMTYVFIGDRGEIAGHAVFIGYGQSAELDQAVAEAAIVNDFPLIPATLYAAAQSESSPRQATGIALQNFRNSLIMHKSAAAEQAAPAEESEHVSA